MSESVVLVAIVLSNLGMVTLGVVAMVHKRGISMTGNADLKASKLNATVKTKGKAKPVNSKRSRAVS